MGKNIDTLITFVKDVVNSVLNEKGLNTDEWHFGTIKRVNTDGTVNLYIDGSKDIASNVSYNPDLFLQPTDKVIVVFLNRSRQNAFVLCKKAK